MVERHVGIGLEQGLNDGASRRIGGQRRPLLEQRDQDVPVYMQQPAIQDTASWCVRLVPIHAVDPFAEAESSYHRLNRNTLNFR